MRRPLLLLLAAGCASSPAPRNYEPCPPGQRFAAGDPAPQRTGILKVLGEGSHIASVFGRDVEGGVEGPPRPLPGAVLEKVELVHTSLPRGASSQGKAHFKIPDGATVRLFASTTVKGYGWNFRVRGTTWNFGVGCYADRPRHVVDWKFILRDEHGRVSNAIDVPVTCTGDPMPGSPPRLDSVELDYDNMIAGQKTGGVARLRGSPTPLIFVAASDSPGYGWTSSPIPESERTLDFAVGCRTDRPPRTVRWRFSVKDSYGRDSNVIEKPVVCGLCVAQK